MKHRFNREHHASDDSDQTAITAATIILDTNALFSLYRQSEQARDTRLSLLEKVRDRLWIPHQVGLEFYRRRGDVIADLPRQYAEAHSAISEVRKTLRQFGEQRYPELAKRVKSVVDEGLDKIVADLDEIQKDDDHTVNLDDDRLLARIETIFAGRVLSQPSPSTIRKRVKRFGADRLPNQIPPGFADWAKVQERGMMAAAGDYLIWCEILEYARRNDEPVLFITDDIKPDWWAVGAMGRPTQPRAELVEEFARYSDARYDQMTVEVFLRKARTHLGADVPESVIEEERAATTSRGTSIKNLLGAEMATYRAAKAQEAFAGPISDWFAGAGYGFGALDAVSNIWAAQSEETWRAISRLSVPQGLGAFDTVSRFMAAQSEETRRGIASVTEGARLGLGLMPASSLSPMKRERTSFAEPDQSEALVDGDSDGPDA